MINFNINIQNQFFTNNEIINFIRRILTEYYCNDTHILFYNNTYNQNNTNNRNSYTKLFAYLVLV